MSAGSGGAQIRIGLVGLDRAGLHHAERLSLRSDITIAAVWDPAQSGPQRLPGWRGRNPQTAARIEDLLSRSDIECVLISGPLERRVDWTTSALEAGKNIALDAPACAHASDLRELAGVARRMGRRLCVLPTRRDSPDFQIARSIVSRGQLGTVHSARLVSWAKAVPREPSANRVDGAMTEADSFTVFAYQYLDQLTQLIPQRPQTVFARIRESQRAADPAPVFLLSIGFDEGADALIDVNLQSGAVLQTGWMLAGDQGAYSGHRLYVTEASGEVCDSPIPPDDTVAPDLYAELLTPLRSADEDLLSATQAATVLHLIEAARESSRTGQAVRLNIT